MGNCLSIIRSQSSEITYISRFADGTLEHSLNFLIPANPAFFDFFLMKFSETDELPTLLSREKKSNIVNNLIEKFFSNSKSLQVREFIEQNIMMLKKLHPALEDFTIMVAGDAYISILCSDSTTDADSESKIGPRLDITWPENIQFLIVVLEMSQTCENFQFNIAEIETHEIFKDIVDEIIQQIEHSSMEKEDGNEIVQREIFRKFLGHLLWLEKLYLEYNISKDGEMRTLDDRAARYYKKFFDQWLESDEIFDDFYVKRNAINHAIEFLPDSMDLRVRLALTDIKLTLIETRGFENDNNDKVQEIINRTLRSFAGDGYKINPKEWVEAVKKEANSHGVIDDFMINMLEFVPDSEWLRIAVAKIEIDDDGRYKLQKIIDEDCYSQIDVIEDKDKDKVQEIIDRTLISFADGGFEIHPNEWIKVAKEVNSNEIIDAVMTSIIGLKGLDENVKSTEDYLNHEKEILCQMLKIFPKDKRLWTRVIFHKKMYSIDLKLLLIIACEHDSDDVGLRDLIQAKIQWINRKFATARRLFNNVKTDNQWGSLIIGEFERFQNELEEFKAERHKLITETLSTFRNLSGQFFVHDDSTNLVYFKHLIKSEVNELQLLLKDEWFLGNEDVVQKVLQKAVWFKPRPAVFWLMKMQIEIKNFHFDAAVLTLENAIKSIEPSFMFNEERAQLLIFIAYFENECVNLQTVRYLLERAMSFHTKYIEIWITLIRFELSSNKNTKAQTLLDEAFEINPKSGQVWAAAISMEERSKRGKKSAEALRTCQDNEYETKFVLFENAKFFFSRGEVNKSRKWFNITVKKYPSFYDAWIYFYKLEKIWGTEDNAREVLIRFMQLQTDMPLFPNHRQFYNYYGEKWCLSEYHIDNWNLTKEELFEVIVNKIDVGSI